MLDSPYWEPNPGDRAEHTGTVSAFMELVSSLREAGSANKCISCPDGGGNKDHKAGKGERWAWVLLYEVKEDREEGTIRSGAWNLSGPPQ